MTNKDNFLGKRLQELRKSKNLTQTELAKLIDVAPKYISRLETGTSNPSLETMKNIAEKLDFELSELFKYSHLRENELLINDIIQKLKGIPQKKLQLIYQVTNDIINME